MYIPIQDISLPLEKIAKHIDAQISTTDNALRAQSISRLCPLQSPSPDGLAFTRPERTQEAGKVLKPGALGALIIKSGFRHHVEHLEIPLLEVENPYLAFCALIPLFYQRISFGEGIHPRSEVDPSAKIGNEVSIGAFAVVGAHAEIGEGSVIHPHAVVYPYASIGRFVSIHAGAVIRERCVVGDMAVIQCGAVIGGDGFGYLPVPKQGLQHIPHVGTVRLGSRVEVGANSCIDRGALEDTSVGIGTKIDNLVQVGHNNTIGSHSILCGLAGIAGSCTIGDEVVVGGGAGIRDHITIASKVRLGGHAGVTSDVTEPGDYTGFPLMKASEWRREAIRIRRHNKRSPLKRNDNSDKA